MRTLAILVVMLATSARPAFAQVANHVEQIIDLAEVVASDSSSESELLERLKAQTDLQAYLVSYGEFLVSQIESDQTPTGMHLNHIHYGLSHFINSSNKLFQDINQVDEIDKKIIARIQVIENFKAVRDTFYNNGLLRKIVRDQQTYDEYGLSLMDSMSGILLNEDNANEIQGYIEQGLKSRSKEYQLLLEQSQAYKVVSNNRPLKDFYKVHKNFGDRVSALIGGITGGLSQGFGSVIGRVEWRTGYLYQLESFKQKVLSDLKPLDLVFEKKAFKLTDKTIPGNWGHVAVWLGTEAQLRELGIWDAPELDVFREKIAAGQSIFEMRRWGMQFDSIDNFLNLDEISITRVSDILNRPRASLLNVFKELGSQLGKKYDFSFDAMATAKVTCTEIIMLSYGLINWPMDRVLGRFSITPNNMAEIAVFNDSPVEFVAYYRAEKLHEVQQLDINEFANVLDYRFNQSTQHFDKVSRKCVSKRYRHHGAIRFKRSCHDEFEEKDYIAPVAF